MIIPDSKEIELIKKFKVRLEHSDLDLNPKKCYSDLHLLRWIRTTNYDLKKSEEMIRKNILWRKAINVEEIQADYEPPDFLQNLLQIQYLGKDKVGNLVFLSPQKTWDLKKFSDESQKDNFEKFFTKLNETYMQFIDEEADEGIPQVVVIYDYSNIPVGQLMNFNAIDRMREKNEHYEQFYPDMFGQAFLVNVPKAFSLLFEMLKPIASKRTLQKFFISSADPPRWRSALLKQIPSDILPQSYGGTRQNPTLHFLTRKEIPLSNSDEIFDLEKGLVQLHIEARNNLSIDFNATQSIKTIRWMVKIVNYDIGISVINSKGDEIVPYEKIKSMVEGSIECHSAPETYSLIVDNTYSRTRGKTFFYNIIMS